MSEITIASHDDDNEPRNYSKGYLTFPFDGDQFQSFITSLLGKPQSIRKRFIGNFEIELKDIQSLFELVNQRITQQNNGALIQFTTEIYFNDESSVQLGSYEELLTYNEVKPIISQAVRLTWDYLIQFSDKGHPEKQVIELNIIAGSRTVEVNFIDSPWFASPNKGQIHFNIDHTARSWGVDIENMLTNQIESLIKPDNKLKSFVRRHSSRISLSFAIIVFLTCIIGAFSITNNFIKKEIETVSSFVDSNKHNIDEKVSYLTSYIASGSSSQHYFKVGVFLLIAIIISIAFGTWIDETASRNSEPSFLVLTRKAKLHRDAVIENMKNKWLWFFASLIISIVTGLLANYIFKLLVE